MKRNLSFGLALIFAFSLLACSLFTPGKTKTPPPAVKADKVWPADGMEMMIVPAGDFQMGSNDGSEDMGTLDMMPMHKVWLDLYWIDKYEVSNSQYELCVKAGACALPHETSSYTRKTYFGDSQYKDFPVIQVDWEMSRVYCAWAGRRLPTEAEWEKAARGTDGRIYPWGNQSPDEELANYFSFQGDTTRVGSYPFGVSPYGALDMSGNVEEWTADYYDKTYYSSQSEWRNPQGPPSGDFRSVRGGNYLKNSGIISAVYRSTGSGAPVFGSETGGFRCAVSAK